MTRRNVLPPEFEFWPYLPLTARLIIALMVLWFRLPSYLFNAHTVSLAAFMCAFAACICFVPEHPLKLVVSLSSASCAAFLSLASGPWRQTPEM